jgi:hypothetical protein
VGKEVMRCGAAEQFLPAGCTTHVPNGGWSTVLATIPEPTCARLNILARRNGRGSTLAARTAMPSGRVSRRNTCGHTSIRDHDNTVDRQLRPRLNLLHNTAPDRNKVRILDRPYNILHSRLRRTELKAEEPTESIAAIWVLFHSHLLFQNQLW